MRHIRPKSHNLILSNGQAKTGNQKDAPYIPI